MLSRFITLFDCQRAPVTSKDHGPPLTRRFFASRRLDRVTREPRSPPGGAASFFGAGGDNRDRTDDLLLAKQALSQLSYIPVFGSPALLPSRLHRPKLVGLGRVELPTSRLSGVRSNQLSYRPPENAPGCEATHPKTRRYAPPRSPPFEGA